MTTLRNRAKEKLEQGRLSIGLGIRQARTVEIGRVLATCGFDWAFIDMEHNSMDIDTAVNIGVACQDAGVTPLVRVPGYEHYHATRVLDSGAMGIVFPHVDSAEHAAQLVSYCKYPPMGHRSVAGTMAQLDYRSLPLAEATELVNRETLVVMMVESPQAIEQADAIAAVPGVDVVLIGSNDLCLEMGIPGQMDHPRLEAAIRVVIDACEHHDAHPGLGGVYDETLTAKFVKMGMRFIISGSDMSMMMSAATARAKFLNNLPLS